MKRVKVGDKNTTSAKFVKAPATKKPRKQTARTAETMNTGPYTKAQSKVKASASLSVGPLENALKRYSAANKLDSESRKLFDKHMSRYKK